MVKTGIKELARERGIEIKKQRIGQLNVLKLRQAYLNTNVGTFPGNLSYLTDLMEVNISISKWYESESENIILFPALRTSILMKKCAFYFIMVYIKNFKKGRL